MSRYSPVLLGRLSEHRRHLGARGPRHFAQVYLAAHCRLPFSRMHDALFEELSSMHLNRGRRMALAAPRGHAKSTILSLAYVLWCILYDIEKCIVILSATKAQAEQLLKAVKEQVQRNPLLLQDFSGICMPEGSGQMTKPWRSNKIYFPNGAMVATYGAMQDLRGFKNDRNRPGLIIADDLESHEHVIAEEQRDKLKRWFQGTVLHAGHPQTNVVVAGTLLHHHSLLSELVDPERSRGWRGLRYRAVEQFSVQPNLWEQWSAIYGRRESYEDEEGPDAAKRFFDAHAEAMLEGAQVLWPELEDYYALMVERERDGRASFQAEKQNEPMDPELCVFQENRFVYWDDKFSSVQELLSTMPEGYDLYGACDPSLGSRTGKGDFSAIVLLAKERKHKCLFVIEADLSRRSPDETIERILRYAQMHPIQQFGVETNQFQELMVENLRRRLRAAGVSLSHKEIKNTGHKHSRISNLEPEVAQGRIQFSRRHQTLLEQIRQFPLAKYDDGPDALEMAVQTSKSDLFFISRVC